MTRVPATMTTGLSSDSHTHTIANVTNLQTSLDGKAASSHTHSGSDITAALDRVRVTTVNGTDAFDAGSINISYEG